MRALHHPCINDVFFAVNKLDVKEHCGLVGLPPWVERWLPIKRLSDEEWEEHERKKKSDFKARWVPLASAILESCL